MNHRDNSDEMNSAIKRLTALGIRHQQTSPFQIKVGPYNFYPNKGTIYLDGAKTALTERGLEKFLTILNNVRTLNKSDSKRASSNKFALHEEERPKEFDIRSAIEDDDEKIRFTIRSAP
ncbi:hypothetical protein HU230_0032820 [Bradyrhizobium quebecense]|uniref:Uncharacterized protein n=1 Tax=Bradyrhizobium quebecense TaxID=2748629 RepID=A0A974AHH0_9BRAD|nr:hypothetical protein [Bradyrhizobium quebecense]UGA43020.1 hypothetical protein HU230_0032820 [Bradyrhizobium quebecense]